MLILTRKSGESIIIDGVTKIIVLGFQGSQVKLGIDSPRDIEVHREEIYLQIEKQKKNPMPSHKLLGFFDLFGRSSIISTET
ncbi:MAG: carbon storage regulator CsrA [Patescibacteria group bacterium]